jgi:hypothetical protein
MRWKFIFSRGQIHEINFFVIFMRSKFLIIIQSPDRGIFHEIEIQKKHY